MSFIKKMQNNWLKQTLNDHKTQNNYNVFRYLVLGLVSEVWDVAFNMCVPMGLRSHNPSTINAANE